MKGMLFTTDMVRAILGNHKTQTRRLIKPQDDLCNGYTGTGFILDTTANKKEIGCFRFDHERHLPIFLKPQYQVGDILYVRETWCKNYYHQYGTYFYRADGETIQIPLITGGTMEYGRADGLRWHPSIHMPKEAARIFLRITDVQVVRIQEITEKDAMAEGIKSYWAEPHEDTPPFIGTDMCFTSFTRREAFAQIWDSIYAAKGYGWDVNPWAWKYTFERVEKP